MKNYDDLQRFREKTQTLDIAFKDMSGQLQKPAEKSQWALIRQLANDEAATPFNGSQRIDLPQPQPLRGNIFSAPADASATQPTTAATPPAVLATQPLMATAPPAVSLTGSLPSAAAPSVAAPRGSILESLAASPPPVGAGAASLPAQPSQSALAPSSETLLSQVARAPQPAEMPQPQHALAQPSATLISQIAQAQPAAMPQPQHALAQPSATLVSPVAHLPSPHSAAPAQYASAQTPASAAGRFSGLFRARHSEPASLPKETLLKPLLEKIALCR